MIGVEDSLYSFEYEDYFKILPSINDWFKDPNRIKNGKKVKKNFRYPLLSAMTPNTGDNSATITEVIATEFAHNIVPTCSLNEINLIKNEL